MLFEGTYNNFRNNTPDWCVAYCTSGGYDYAGLQYGSQCICTNSGPQGTSDAGQCTYGCAGANSVKMCGGLGYINIFHTDAHKTTIDDWGCGNTVQDTYYQKWYNDMGHCNVTVGGASSGSSGSASSGKSGAGSAAEPTTTATPTTTTTTTTTPAPTTPTTTAALTQWEFNGKCFKDSKNRVLDYMKNQNPYATVQKCIEFCQNKGWPYAGPQYGYWCHCGVNQPLEKDLVGDSDCNTKCYGDSSAICGGYYRMNVYRTNATIGPCKTDPTIVQDTSPDTDKFSAINTLVNADMYDGDNNYMRNRANWLGRSNEAAHFVIDLGCQASLSTLAFRNSGDSGNRGTRAYVVSVSESESGSWQDIIGGTFNDPRSNRNDQPTETFNIDLVTARYVKFSCTSWYGSACALQYINAS